MDESQNLSPRGLQIQRRMKEHVAARLQAALAKWDGKTDSNARREIQKLQEKYRLGTILTKGAPTIHRITIASHIAKGIHPDLKVKDVSNLAVDFSQLPTLNEVGSHILPDDKNLLDASGDGAYNSAAYELYLLLSCRFEGKRLAEWLHENDPDTKTVFAILSGIMDEDWAALLESKCSAAAVSSLNKQLYWLVGDDPCSDTNYTLLAPLYATSLAHAVHARIQEARFGEANKAARSARREGRMHDGILQEYPGLAAQKLGGTKPQNISQLNSERGGVNYLLASLPPSWRSSRNRMPANAASVFDRLFGARPLVRDTLRELRDFLQSNPPANVKTRQRRENLIRFLIDELSCMAAELQQGEPAGWTRDHARFGDLVRSEQLWLDPGRAALDGEDAFARDWLALQWPVDIGRRFANWLNGQLDRRLPMDEVTARHWRDELLDWDSAFAEQLRQLHPQIPATNETAETAP